MRYEKNKKTGIYSAVIKTANGKIIKRSLGTRNKDEAKMLAKEAKLAEIEAAARIKALTRDTITAIVAGKNIKIQEVVGEYEEFRKMKSHSKHTIYTEGTVINSFLKFSKLQNSKISSITTKHIYEFVNVSDKTSYNHKCKKLTAVKGLLTYAIANAYILKDPSYGVSVDKSLLSHKQKEKKKSIAFTKSDYERIRKHCSYFWSIAADFAWWTGLRIGDIASLEWDMFNDKYLTVHTQKTDARVSLPIDDELIGGGILHDTIARIEPEDKKYCFPIWKKIYDNVSSRATLAVYFGRELERKHPKAYEEGKRFHSFRRSFVTRCAREGKELSDIAVMVGHANESTTQLYDTGSRL